VGAMTPDPSSAVASHLFRPDGMARVLRPNRVAHLVGLAFGHRSRPATVHGLFMAVAHLQLSPDTSALPGGNVLQRLMNGLDGWALALSLVGLVVGAAAWALGSHGQNYQQSFVGRRAVLISGFAALLIGAGPGIVNFFFNTGQGVH
jgi:Family of unknown function (DUF6112)